MAETNPMEEQKTPPNTLDALSRGGVCDVLTYQFAY